MAVKATSFANHSTGVQQYTLNIPFDDLVRLDLDQQVKDLIRDANMGKIDQYLTLALITMLILEINDRPDLMEEQNNGNK